MSKPVDSGYKVESIALVDCFFSRAAILAKNSSDPSVDISVNVDYNQEDRTIQVLERVSFTQENGSTKQKELEFNVAMVGLFRFSGSTSVDPEAFGKLNGAAIIFPFIREHIMNLSIKARLNPIILPPVNFAAMREEPSNPE